MNVETSFIDLSRCRPLADRILLRRIETEAIGPLIIPDIAKQAAHRGEVVAVGPGRSIETDGRTWRRPVDVMPGQVVQYMSFDIDDGTHVLIQEADILFVEANA